MRRVVEVEKPKEFRGFLIILVRLRIRRFQVQILADAPLLQWVTKIPNSSKILLGHCLATLGDKDAGSAKGAHGPQIEKA